MKANLRIIAGADRGKRLRIPSGNSIRPTAGMAREALFNILQDRIEGATFLDLYAGTGSIGLEALSRGAAKVTLGDNNHGAIAVLKENASLMARCKDVSVLSGNARDLLKVLARNHETFEIIFLDPPYTQAGVNLSEVEPVLAPLGMVIHQHPRKTEFDRPFRVTALQLYDQRCYGKSEFSFWSWPGTL